MNVKDFLEHHLEQLSHCLFYVQRSKMDSRHIQLLKNFELYVTITESI